MTEVQAVFLRCLADFCRGEETPFPEKMPDAEALFSLARKHSLSGVIYLQCHNWLNDYMKRGEYADEFTKDIFFSINRADMLSEMVRCFHDAGIPVICMKGGVFRDCWPVPEIRTMGDIDLVIREEDRVPSDKIMMENLSCKKSVDNHAVWTYTYGPLEFEVHDHMFYEYLVNRLDYREYFDKVWEHKEHGTVFGVADDSLYVPEPEFHFLYLMAHTARHIINNGSGFRAFLDMVFFTRKYSDKLDWCRLEAELDRIQLLRFTKTCFRLCERWFEVEMPLKSEEIEEDFFQSVTQKICSDGVFGRGNPQNEAAGTAKELERSKYPYAIASAMMTAGMLFPTYSNMLLNKRYSWVDGKPWLLPVAWVYRWIYCLVNKKDVSIKRLSEPFIKKELVDKRQQYNRNWGL